MGVKSTFSVEMSISTNIMDSRKETVLKRLKNSQKEKQVYDQIFHSWVYI